MELLSATRTPPPVRNEGAKIYRTVRAAEWWEFKLAPTFATVYATALYLNSPVGSLWPLFLLALGALVPGAAYVSVINDLTDREEDLASGKDNRLRGKSATFVALLLACCIVPGVAVSLYWRDDPLLLSLYLAAWAAFSLYSIPPFRLKKRGVLGLLADASGAHLFPTLLVVALVFRWRDVPVDPVWFAAVALWSLSFGLRGNLWHQLSDAENDQKVGLRTFARRHKITLLHGLGNLVIFPLEAAGFALVLWRAGSRFALAALALYALLEWSRRVMWRTGLVVVAPRERASILMLEYYEVFFPLALLVSSSARHPADALVLLAHLALFPRRAAQVARDVFKLVKQSIGMLVR